jgi:hypothetical protein
MDDLPPALLEDLRDSRCVLWVGAGVSASAGLPNWETFLRHIAACAGIKWVWGGACDDVQFELVEAVGRERFVSLMSPILRPESPPSQEFHRLCELMGLANFAAIVSTNWDMLLDESGCCSQVAHLGRDDAVIDDVLFKEAHLHDRNSTSSSRKPILIKLQGDISHPSTLSLSRSDYSLTYAAKSEFLDRLTRRYSIFSIGRSGRQVGHDFAACTIGTPPLRMRQFFVCNDLSKEDKQKLAVQGVTALSYSSQDTNLQGNRMYLEKIVHFTVSLTHSSSAHCVAAAAAEMLHTGGT